MDGIARRAAVAPESPRAPRRRRTTRVKCSSAARAASSPCERATIQRASASFASIGSPSGTGSLGDERPPLCERAVGDPHRPAEHLLGRRRERDVVADRRAHLLAVPARAAAASSARPAARARSASITSRPGEQVVELVGAAELDVGLDRDRVVAPA